MPQGVPSRRLFLLSLDVARPLGYRMEKREGDMMIDQLVLEGNWKTTQP